MRRLLLPLIAAMVLAACTGGQDADPSPSPAPSPTTPAASPTETGPGADPAGHELSQTCTFTSGGVEVAVPYPAGWHTNDTGPTEDGSAMPPCRVFHHEPFELPRTHELTGYDFFVSMESVPFARIAGSDDDPMHELLRNEETQVDGRDAVVRELRATEDGLSGPIGARHYLYAVDLGGERTLIAVTYEVADLNYARNRDLLDAVMEDMTIGQGQEAACSASGPDVAEAPGSQPGLPAPVARTRAAIHQAAVACDYDGLAQLAGERFTYSFGDDGNPAGHWRRQEAEGDEPMRYLAGMLNRPYATMTVEGGTQYAWPSAFAYGSWEEVPEADREALKPLYDEADFADFAQFGGYIGYRIVIAEDGTWTVFVAGD